MNKPTATPLAELHLHHEGSIHYADFLELIRDRAIDWGFYESAYESAYGETPPIREVLERYRSGIPGADDEFHRLFVFGDQDAGSFQRFQAKFELLTNGSQLMDALQGRVAFSALVDEVCYSLHKVIARQRQQGIRYAEYRMRLSSRFSADQKTELLLAMLKSYAEYETSDFQPRLAMSLERSNPWPGWQVTRELALGPYGHLLTGIDFCYFEEGYPPKEKRSFFDEVKAFNRRYPERALAILYHVGESFEDKSLESAVRWVHEASELGAHRLGHAIALGVDPENYGRHERTEAVSERVDQLHYDLRHADGLRRHNVPIDEQSIAKELSELEALPGDRRLTVVYDQQRLDEIRDRQRYAMECIRSLGSIIEVCPTSNRRIGGISRPEHHPVIQLLANDVPFVVASDNPGIFGTTLAEEIEWVIQTTGMSPDSFDEIALRSWRYRSEVLTGRETPAV